MDARSKSGGKSYNFLNGKAIYWRAEDALLVADLHIGKGAAFRAGAVFIPSGSSEETLARLSDQLLLTGASKLYILGDFWHAKQGRTDEIHDSLFEWRENHSSIEIVLIEGNHDKRSGALPEGLRIETVQELRTRDLVLKHHPEEDDRGYVLAGHVHPGVRLIGCGRQVEKLPAFIFALRVGILPAFGEFTGAATVYPAAEDRVFVIAEDAVMEVGLTGVGSLR